MKQTLSFDVLDAQTAVELPDRDMMALVNAFVPITLVDVIDVNGNQVIAQVPVGVAANVCGVSVAAVLAAAGTDDSACTAFNEQLPTAFQQR